jgi:hypothetical protein
LWQFNVKPVLKECKSDVNIQVCGKRRFDSRVQGTKFNIPEFGRLDLAPCMAEISLLEQS